MGYAVAEAAAALGADVTLVSGPTALAAPARIQTVRVTSAAQMASAVKANLAGTDFFFSVAAVADYTPVERQDRKLKKSGAPMEVKLKPTEDILGYVAGLPGGPFCIGFAAESENLGPYAQEKRQRKKIPMIVANLVQNAIGQDDNEVTIYDDHGAHPLDRAPKTRIAHAIIAHALKLHEARQPSASVTPIKQAS
jgi:phosphopantothenoylcysteine decarboxylase/phosphopantothenate--cysteine ligase